jgi:hypothetical protein
MALADMGGSGSGETPGSGGVSRGRGDAALSYTTPSSEQGVTFVDKQLKSAGGVDASGSTLVSIQYAAPEVNRQGAGGAAGVLRTTKASGGSASGTTVLPKHKAAVSQYFTRTQP